MHRALYVLIFITAFLTGNYLLLVTIPIYAWLIKNEKKKRRTKQLRRHTDLVRL